MPTQGLPLSGLLDFTTVAVIGASNDPDRIGGRPIALLRKFGFEGALYGVNPKYKQVMGEPCVADARELPSEIDLAIFAVPAQTVLDTLPELGRHGIRAAVVFSAGFNEAGPAGELLQSRLTAMALESHIALLGPNCLGTISFTHRTCATFASSLTSLPDFAPGSVALVSQSGAFATNVLADAMLAGVRFSHVITTGNEAVVGVEDFFDYLADDPATSLVLGYIEGLRDGKRFCAAAGRLQAAGKPLVLMKVGRSTVGARAVQSHTGLMAGDDASFQAAFDRYGVTRVQTLDELADHARVFSMPDTGRGVTIVTTSGAGGVYAADLCAQYGLMMTRLTQETIEALHDFIPTFGVATNPVDLTGQAVFSEASLLRKGVETLMQDPGTGTLLCLLGGQTDAPKARILIDLFRGVQHAFDPQLVLVLLGVPEQVRIEWAASGLTVFSDPARFLRALAHRRASALNATRETSAPAEGLRAIPDLEASIKGPRFGRLIDEWESLNLLEAEGVAVPRRMRVSRPSELKAAARSIGFPCVMKLLRPLVAHRSNVGGVVTDIVSEAQMNAAWSKLVLDLGAEEVLLAEQLEPGLELLVGVVDDATFGQRIVIGAGGVQANGQRDFVTLIPPLTRDYVVRSLSLLNVWSHQVANRPTIVYPLDSLVGAVRAVAFIGEREGLMEFECNPLIVTPSSVVAVDGLGVRQQA